MTGGFHPFSNFKGQLGCSVPGQWSRSDNQLEVELVDAEMFGQGGVVQVVFILNLEGVRIEPTSSVSDRFSSLEDFLVPALSSGNEISGPLWSPFRLFVNICTWWSSRLSSRQTI